MQIEKHSKPTKDYINFVINGLEKYEKANKVIEKIDVFNSSIRITYKNEGTLSELLFIHSHIEDYGMRSFFSMSDMKNGNTVRYDLRD